MTIIGRGTLDKDEIELVRRLAAKVGVAKAAELLHIGQGTLGRVCVGATVSRRALELIRDSLPLLKGGHKCIAQ